MDFDVFRLTFQLTNITFLVHQILHRVDLVNVNQLTIDVFKIVSFSVRGAMDQDR